MAAEIKPGKWRLADGREVVVLSHDTRDSTVCMFSGFRDPDVDNLAMWWPADVLEGAEYLGPAVIGEVTADDHAYPLMMARHYEQQCKQLEAETVATRELLEKSEEQCEELAKELAKSREQVSCNSLSLETLRIDHAKLTRNVSCEVDGDLCTYRFKSVTVMVRGEREATAVQNSKSLSWYGKYDTELTRHMDREEAEAWCREQLEPKWREAGEGDRGKACRVRDDEDQDWRQGERLIHIIDHEFRFVVDKEFDSTYPVCYKFCEVRD